MTDAFSFLPLWTVKDVARWLGCSEGAVRHRVVRGQLPAVHIGASLRFRPEDIAAFLAEQKDAT